MCFFLAFLRPRCTVAVPCHPGRYARTYVLKPARLVLIFRGTEEVPAPVILPMANHRSLAHSLAPYESSERAPWGRPSPVGLVALSAVARSREGDGPALLGQYPPPPSLSLLAPSIEGSLVVPSLELRFFSQTHANCT